MKWTRGQFRKSRRDRKAEWHYWFAWYPVTITGTGLRVWLETVDRRVRISLAGIDYWEYKV